MSTFELQENYSSDSNDDDYVPNADEIDSEDELVKVTQGEDDDDESKLITRSKRKKIEAEIETYNNIKKQKFEEKISKESNTINEERKSKIDALWAELNAEDDDYPPIPAKSVNSLANNKSLTEKNVTGKQKFPLTKDPTSTNMITITKTYKFAGDIITEHKQVPEGSEEAINFLEQEKTNKASETSNEKLNSILSTSSKTFISQKDKSPFDSNKNGGKSGRSKVSLEQLAASLKKKPTKLNTLEKSKMDWKKYIEQEQIVDELKYHNKNGYIEKQEFLQRTYERQESEIKSLRKDSRNK